MLKRSVQLILSFTLLFMFGIVTSANEQVPKEAIKYAENNFYKLVENSIFSDNPENYGFEKEMRDITFSDLYPLYSLTTEFATGKSSEIMTGTPDLWISIIYQNGHPVNAIGIYQKQDNTFDLATIGFPSELPRGIEELKKDEILIYEFPTEEYYAYSKQNDTIKKIKEQDGKSTAEVFNKLDFQKNLQEKYENNNSYKGDDISGSMSAKFNEEEFSRNFPFWLVALLGLVPLVFFLKKRLSHK